VVLKASGLLREQRYHGAFEEVRDRIAGACSYCAGRYGVKEQVEQAGIALLDE
jgi:hypothetical protein